jgi:hypothetical protein
MPNAANLQCQGRRRILGFLEITALPAIDAVQPHRVPGEACEKYIAICVVNVPFERIN